MSQIARDNLCNRLCNPVRFVRALDWVKSNDPLRVLRRRATRLGLLHREVAARGSHIKLRHGYGQTIIPIPRAAMIAGEPSNVELARRLGLDEKAVRRLRDPLHRSHIGQSEVALHELGRRVELLVEDAA